MSVQNENSDATVIINGGHIKAGWYAVAGNGQDSTFNGNITVNGGILESTADYAIYHPHTGTTTINSDYATQGINRRNWRDALTAGSTDVSAMYTMDHLQGHWHDRRLG